MTNTESAKLRHTSLKRQIVQELARSGKWHRMPELLDQIDATRMALQAQLPAPGTWGKAPARMPAATTTAAR